MPPMKRLLPTILLLLALPALAGEAEIRQALKARFPSIRVDGIQAAPMPGLFEVRFQTRDGPQLLYTDAQGNFLIVEGNLIDAKSGRNLTEERLQKLTAIAFSALPLDMAVKVQRGNGKRVLAMFSDPYCPEKADHSRAVWCAPDRAKAWLELAASDTPKVPAGGAACDNPVDKVLELGRSLRVNGTPTLFFANGERASGGMEVGKLRAKMDEIARVPTRKN